MSSPAPGAAAPTRQRSEAHSGFLDVAEALQTIQDHTTTLLTIPSNDETTIEELMDVIRAAKVLRGEPVTLRVTSIDCHLTDGHPDIRTGGGQAISLTNPLDVKIGTTEVNLGSVHLKTDTAYLTVTRTGDGDTRVVATSADGGPLTLQLSRMGRPQTAA